MAKARKPKSEEQKPESSSAVVRHQKLCLSVDTENKRLYGYGPVALSCNGTYFFLFGYRPGGNPSFMLAEEFLSTKLILRNSTARVSGCGLQLCYLLLGILFSLIHVETE